MTMDNNQTTPCPQIGDWVSYADGNSIAIGQVMYIQTARHYPWKDQAVLHTGRWVRFEDILELRSPNGGEICVTKKFS